MRNGKTAALLLLLMMLIAGGNAMAKEAPELSAACKFRMSWGGTSGERMTDGKYTTYWHSKESVRPYVILQSETPVYGLYLCFREMPE